MAWDARRPVWMVHADYAPARFFGLELAAKPVFEPALTVPERWFAKRVPPTHEELREGLVQQFIGQGMDPDTARMIAGLYRIAGTEDFRLPDNTLRSMTGGLRAKTRLAMFDLSASLVRGYDFLPHVQPETNLDPQAYTFDFTLRARYPRKTVIGADIAASIMDAGLWAEAAYDLYDDTLARRILSPQKRGPKPRKVS